MFSMAGKYSCLIYLVLYMGSFLGFSNCQSQNKPPVWINYLKTELQDVGIFEDTKVGTILGYLRASDPEGDPIRYECQSQTVECLSDGRVTLVRKLDREFSIKNPTESDKLLETTFIAVEVNNNKQDPSRNSKTITIYVRDVNDNAPQFLNVPYKTSTPESAAVGDTVFKGVSVEDIDSGVNAEVTLKCFTQIAQDREACEYFSIETVRDSSKNEGKYNGYIILKKPLDYEKRSSYVMTILATDKGSPVLSSSVNVLILVSDIQDNPPFFQQSPYTIFVSEDKPVNEVVTKLKAQDGDTGNPNPVMIEITDDPKGYFQLGPTVPENSIIYAADLSLKKTLDRETIGERYSFKISVTELKNGVPDPSAKSYSSVNVEILDENDNAPHFMKDQYSMTFAEFGKVKNTGILVGNPIVAVDKDSSSNAIFTIEITDQTIPGVFGVSPTSGIKSTVVNLIALKPNYLDYDNEKYRNQRVVITVRQANSTRKLSSSTVVTITLTDQNDNPPIFKKRSYEARIPEDMKVGTSILSLEATDKDSGRNKEIIYQIDGYGSEYFSVHANGKLILQKKLDFEFLNTYNLLAYARDKGEQSLISSVDVTIFVTDVNDNGPVFNPKSYSTTIKELSTTFEPDIQIHATDKDAGTQINYAIESGNTLDTAFTIDPTTGRITLKRGIKTEDIKGDSGTLFLKVRATDNGNPPRSSFVTVNINILDINNHAPVFLEQSYEKSLKEFTPRGTFVLAVTATDADQGVNAELEYSIEDGNFDAFRIEPKTGKIYVASETGLDSDIRNQFNMTVKAEDQGVPRQSSTTSVIIKLIDINNKKPKFDQSEYFVTINEKTALDTSILRVSATDNDANSELVYSIDKRSIIARKADGKILPLSTLDYSNAFNINSKTGDITTNMKLSQSLFPTISFDVIAKDLKADSLSTQISQVRVVVIIHASKRKLPYFIPEDAGQGKKIYRFTLPEDKQEGLRITRLEAIDPITGNLVSKYQFLSNNSTKGIFDITDEGYVYLKKTLDYESMTTNPLTFHILAIGDPTRTSTAEMQITVVDVNDNSPRFDRNAYVFNISETLRYPNTVGFVKATDQDSSSYGEISYSIEGLGHEDFWMLPTGEIIVNKKTQLDYEKNKVYLLQVTATDNPSGDTHRKTLVKLTVNVMDMNDNAPIFYSNDYTFYATEMSDIGDSIGTVSAKDIDSGYNSQIEYSLSPIYTDNREAIFTMDRNTGQIRVATKLVNVAEKSPIKFLVFAQDQGIPSQTGQAPATVFISTSSVLDIPKILKPRPGENATIPENAQVNSVVYTMFAKARDNSSIVYSFDEPDNSELRQIFSINPETGEITLIKPLDHEDQPAFYILMKATDKKNDTLYSTQRLRILVSDVDDNAPSFDSCDMYKKIISASIQENYPIKSYVVKVTACDRDSKPFNSMQYVWENTPGCANAEANFTAFKLISESGLIETGEILNFEKTKEYLLCVRVIPATNKNKRVAGNQLTSVNNQIISVNGSVQQILVKVRDSNDNGPIFPNHQMFAVINEKTILGSEVVRVTADDADNYPNNQVKYSIINIAYHPPNSNTVYSAQTAFKVTEDTGVIITNLQSYTEFVRGDFLVTLRAEDASIPQFFNTTNVKIYVIQPRQRSRIVLPNSPKESNGKALELVRKLNELNQGRFRSQDIHYHQGQNGFEVYDKTDVCLIIEDKNHILTLEENENVFQTAKVQDLLKQFDAGTQGSCNPETSISYASWSTLWWVLVVFAIFMFICTVILIVAICLLYKSHKQYMESERTSLIKN